MITFEKARRSWTGSSDKQTSCVAPSPRAKYAAQFAPSNIRQLLPVIAAISLIVPEPGFACLWDYDTLAMERQRFPEAHELIAGHFVRHSDAYYEWRISDRTAKPVDQRTPLDFDDIAVACLLRERPTHLARSIRSFTANNRRQPAAPFQELSARLLSG